MGEVNLGCMYRLENKRLESSAMERDLGVLVDGKLKMNQQTSGSQEGQPCSGGIRQNITSQLREGIVLLYSEMVQPHLKSCVHFWERQNKKDKKFLERIQRRAMKMVKVLEGKTYEEWLRSLGLFSLEKSLRGDLIVLHSFLTRESRGADTDLFSVVTSDSTR
ncbi:hypothetical protein BTVI_106471 [Pitangus sulphuratus]|nr:hypothetical protein BTVI_106471 [Pitangus sulphuratus]